MELLTQRGVVGELVSKRVLCLTHVDGQRLERIVGESSVIAVDEGRAERLASREGRPSAMLPLLNADDGTAAIIKHD